MSLPRICKKKSEVREERRKWVKFAVETFLPDGKNQVAASVVSHVTTQLLKESR
jgi:hypothetical protein